MEPLKKFLKLSVCCARNKIKIYVEIVESIRDSAREISVIPAAELLRRLRTARELIRKKFPDCIETLLPVFDEVVFSDSFDEIEFWKFPATQNRVDEPLFLLAIPDFLTLPVRNVIAIAASKILSIALFSESIFMLHQPF